MTRKYRFEHCPRCRQRRRRNGTTDVWLTDSVWGEVCWLCSAVLGLHMREDTRNSDYPSDWLAQTLRAIRSVDLRSIEILTRVNGLFTGADNSNELVVPDAVELKEHWNEVKRLVLEEMDPLIEHLRELQLADKHETSCSATTETQGDTDDV